MKEYTTNTTTPITPQQTYGFLLIAGGLILAAIMLFGVVILSASPLSTYISHVSQQIKELLELTAKVIGFFSAS